MKRRSSDQKRPATRKGKTGDTVDSSASAAGPIEGGEEAAITPPPPGELPPATPTGFAADVQPPDREEEIRLRAYEIWLAEGRPEGRDRIHWEQAERDVMGAVRGPEDGIAETEIERIAAFRRRS